MSEPFLGEIRIIGFNFAPRDWAYCDGQILPINQNQSLYSLLGTTYGGDGRTSFALPDLRSRTPMHVGTGRTLGQKTGQENVTLIAGEIAAHSHTVRAAAADATLATPKDNLPAPTVGPQNVYGDAANLAAGRSGQVSNVGGGQSHNNMQPYLTLGFCIALRGLFPSRN